MPQTMMRMTKLRRGLTRLDHPTGIARGHDVRRHILGYDRTSTDQAARADVHPWHDETARAHKGVLPDGNPGGHERLRRQVKIVAPGAKINFLRYRRARPYINFA